MQNPIIRFGIIGAVGRGGGFVGALQAHPSTEITALCDIREEQVKQSAEELGVQHVFIDKEGTMPRSSTPSTSERSVSERQQI